MNLLQLRAALHRAADAFVDSLLETTDETSKVSKTVRRSVSRNVEALPTPPPKIDDITRARAHAAMRKAGITVPPARIVPGRPLHFDRGDP